MIRIQQLKLKLGESEQKLPAMAAKKLRISTEHIEKFQIRKKSIDARKKPALFFVYTVDVEINPVCGSENHLIKRAKDKNVLPVNTVSYSALVTGSIPLAQPIVVGAGPAGLFCTYMLASAGYRPILLERGGDVDERSQAVERFWESGLLDPECNVQFGEGGAGTFSDGKLNTLVHDKLGRSRFVLETFVKFGAPECILYDSKPHIGTDVLKTVVKAMRQEIIRLGGTVCFHQKLTDIEITDKKREIVINHTKRMPFTVLVLALGHSARDTISMLYDRNMEIEPKAFAVGVRVEHPQAVINEVQYGAENGPKMDAAPYKVTAKASDGRGVYSFCMCPGGYVVNASSEPGRLAVNGMSNAARDSKNANSAIIVSVTPEDFPNPSPLAGFAFQRDLEEKAYQEGRGKIPVQLYKDYKRRQCSTAFGDYLPCTKGETTFGNLRSILPDAIGNALEEGIEQFAAQIPGFNRPDMIMEGVESRTSSPVRLKRNEDYLSNLAGIYPCGEGAGYAGGIMSAAMDGMKVFEAIAKNYCVAPKNDMA